MPHSTYAPLRVHGHHSLLTGVDSPRALLERAAQLGLPAIALVDVDSIAGLVEAAQERARMVSEWSESGRDPAGIPRWIHGAEISDPSERFAGRLIALCENEVGYKNLCRLISARRLGEDPGEVEAGDLPEEGEHAFDRVDCATRFQEGLIYLVDHPELLVQLGLRVDSRHLFAAIAPAGLSKSPLEAAAAPGRTRNVTLEPRRSPITRRRSAPEETASDEHALAEPKTPPPAISAPALDLIEAARAARVATVAVPDTWYAAPSGAHDHGLRVAIKHNALLADLPPGWLAEKPAHLLAPFEVIALYTDLPDARGPFAAITTEDSSAPPPCVQRTLEIADRCRFEPLLGETFFPDIDLGEFETAYSKLWQLSFDGARERYRPLRPEVVRRLDYELTTIDRLGFSPYFLLVRRITDFAQEAGIPYVGRGSAADSLVAFCLGLTDADPLRYRLCFERFLNPTRKDRPDIDLDFCWRRRDEVLEHVYELFGSKRTAMICTLNRFGLRSAFREVALAEGLPPAEVNRWSRRLPYAMPSQKNADFDGTVDGGEEREPWHIPTKEAAPNLVAEAFRATPEARDFPFEDERYQRVLNAAMNLIDAPRHFGLHPGGVVVSPGTITDFTACHRAAKGVVVTQYDKDAIEAIGLVKMDLLGNRALTTLDDALQALRERGVEVDLHTLPEDDPATASTLREGRTLGCFQVESPGMRHLLQQMEAKNMDDVIQAVALIRPGPASSGMKEAFVRRARGLDPATPPHERLTDVLWDTHGVMLYQEDVMQTAAAVAGMDLAEADRLRRALQKRRFEDLRDLCTEFIAGCRAEGVDEKSARHVWDLIANFASFAFNKAHSVTYGRIAYRAAWLKTHHPAVFLASFLASQTGYYAQRVYIEEARRLGVPILGPDVNKSGATFAVEWKGDVAALRVGLGQVKGLSLRAIEAVLEKRKEAPFLSLPDFLERTRAHTDEAENLIQCGAFDSFDRTRPELSWRLHLLRTPQRKAPRGFGRPELDYGQLDAAQATPESKTRKTLRSAQSRTGGWSQKGLGMTGANLRPGEEATLFSEPDAPGLVLPGLPDSDAATRGRLEFDLLGLNIREHPLAIFPCPATERIGTSRGSQPPNPISCAELTRFVGGRVSLHGWPAATRRVFTADGRWMRFLTLEDETALAEGVLFPDVYERYGHLLAGFGSLVVTGVVHDQLGACTLHVERIW